jgi:hypothetical protein
MDSGLASLLIAVITLGLLVVILLRGLRNLKSLPGAQKVDMEKPGKTLQRLATEVNTEGWAQKHGLHYRVSANWHAQAARMEASPEKTFFRADQVMDLEDDSPFASGMVQDRMVWAYGIVGKPRIGSGAATQRAHRVDTESSMLGIPTTRENFVVESVMYLWCIEVSTNPIPFTLTITRQNMREPDVLNTESADFEKRYDISNTQDSMVLQLLDPAMMDAIMQSRADAIEFSDSSVVFYEVSKHVTMETLDAMLAGAISIAKQVDRNYPLGKYAKATGN